MLDPLSSFLFVCAFTALVVIPVWMLTERRRRGDARLDRIGSFRRQAERRPEARQKPPWLLRLDQQIEDAIDRAGVSWTREMYLQRLALGILVGIAVPWFVLSAAPAPVRLLLMAAGAYAGYVSPRWWLERARRERQKQLHSQLPDILATLTAATHANLSWAACFQQGAAELPSPARDEFLRTFHQLQMGMTVEEALLDLQRRIGSEDFDFVIQAVLLQKEEGGRLRHVFSTAQRILRERVEVRREVEAKLASARSTAVTGTIIPIALLLMMRAFAPDMVAKLTGTLIGQMALLVAFLLWATGQLIIRRMANSVQY